MYNTVVTFSVKTNLHKPSATSDIHGGEDSSRGLLGCGRYTRRHNPEVLNLDPYTVKMPCSEIDQKSRSNPPKSRLQSMEHP
jgi:hypothetical protein